MNKLPLGIATLFLFSGVLSHAQSGAEPILGKGLQVEGGSPRYQACSLILNEIETLLRRSEKLHEEGMKLLDLAHNPTQCQLEGEKRFPVELSLDGTLKLIEAGEAREKAITLKPKSECVKDLIESDFPRLKPMTGKELGYMQP